MRIAFRFRPIPFVATVLLVALGVALGQWQDRRAAGKIAIQHTARGARRWRRSGRRGAAGAGARVEYGGEQVTGEFVRRLAAVPRQPPAQWPRRLLPADALQNRRLTLHVLVARGWLPRNNAERRPAAAVRHAAGTVTIEGVAKASIGHMMQLGTARAPEAGRDRAECRPAQFAAASGLASAAVFYRADRRRPATAGARLAGAGARRRKAPGLCLPVVCAGRDGALFFILTGFRRGNKITRTNGAAAGSCWPCWPCARRR
jgi:surfeit locus 1 family protein